MKTRHSKTKNFKVYTYLLKFLTLQEALLHLDPLARQLKRHKNAIISIVAQAKKNPLIYQELRSQGYAEDQIPEWFVRPKEDESQAQTSSETNSTSSLKHEQPKTSNIQTRQIPQPFSHMGIKVYDWEELQRNPEIYPPKTITERILEEQYREYEEIIWKDHLERKKLERRLKEEELNKKIEKELAETHDPWTALQILKKNPKWLTWYNSLTPQEQNKTFGSICEIYRFINENKIAQENQRKWNEFWWWGRFLGKW